MKMKNLTKLAYLGAIAFVGIGFTACSSDDDAVENNPSFDGKAVKTQFAINIPRAATPSSRMSADNTQNNNSNFLGMEKIHLLSFAGEPGTTGYTASTSDIGLADISTTPGISSISSSKIYSDVNVPVGTSHFLFYAVAPQGTDANSKFSKGVLDATIGASTDAINFKLQQIATSIDNDEQTQLLSVLNAVATVTNWKDQDANSTGLGKLYASFIKLKAGSANSIRAALENLYNAVAIWADGAEDGNKTIATAIRTAITTGGYFTATNNSGVYTLSTSLKYPRNINLPDGAVQLAFDSQNNSFSYGSQSSLTSIPNLNPTTLTYPASLYYFISTDIRTSTSTYDNWPTSVSDWASDLTTFWNSFNSTDAKVTATTRAIALKKNIQYGVANLKLSAYCTAQKLSDATRGSEGSTAKTVNVPADGFKITGVIIGGQPTQVGYNFLPADAQSLTQHIYDKDVASTMCARYATNATDATVNYTMVLPNQLGGSNTEQPVSFAIEFKNNSSVEFQGVDGVVPVGGKFYLVGKLVPTNQTLTGVTNPSVFMPDYQTTVTAKISTLKNAYNTIPDLRATNMQLGLSVDLTWTAGLTFEVDLGGDTN